MSHSYSQLKQENEDIELQNKEEEEEKPKKESLIKHPETEEEFNQLLKNHKKCFVDYFATWWYVFVYSLLFSHPDIERVEFSKKKWTLSKNVFES